MSTQRYIDVSFYDDAWVQELDPSEKFMYMYLLTNPLTNIAGVYKITPKRISFDTGFNIDTVKHIINKFCTAGKVYQRDEYIIMKNWCKHQKIESGNTSKISNVKIGIDKILKDLSDDMLLFLKEIDFSYVFLDDILKERGLETLGSSSNYLNLNSNLNLNSISSSAPSESASSSITETDTSSDTDTNDYIAELERRVKEQAEELKNKDSLIAEQNKALSKKVKTNPSPTKFKNEDYYECMSIISSNKTKLLKAGKDIDSTVYAVPQMKKWLKRQFEYYGVEDTKKGLINSVNYTWLVNESRYSMSAMFSDKVFPKLIANETGSTRKPNNTANKSGSINFDEQNFDEEVF